MVAPNCTDPKRHYLHKRWSDCHTSLRAFDPTDPRWGNYYEKSSEPWPGQAPTGITHVAKESEWVGDQSSLCRTDTLGSAVIGDDPIENERSLESPINKVPHQNSNGTELGSLHGKQQVPDNAHDSTPPSPFTPLLVPILTLSPPSSASDPPPSPCLPPAPPPTPSPNLKPFDLPAPAAAKQQKTKRVRWVDDPVKDLPSLTDVLEVQTDGTLNLLRILARTLELSLLLSESCTNKAIAISAQEHEEFPESTIPEIPGPQEIEREERVAVCILEDAREVRELLRDVRGDDVDECGVEWCDDTREEDKEMDMVIRALDMLVGNARGVLEELRRMSKEKERGGM